MGWRVHTTMASLVSLPQDAIMCIAAHLPVDAFVRLGRANRELRAVVLGGGDGGGEWRVLVERDFARNLANKRGRSWSGREGAFQPPSYLGDRPWFCL